MKSITFLIVALFCSLTVTAQEPQAFYLSQKVSGTVETVSPKVKEALKMQGFGIVSEIDMQKTLKDKIDVSIPAYKIYGVCNAKLAHQLYQEEANIGVLLPCKMIIKQIDDQTVEVAFMDPVKLLQTTGNKDLYPVGKKVKQAFMSILMDL